MVGIGLKIPFQRKSQRKSADEPHAEQPSQELRPPQEDHPSETQVIKVEAPRPKETALIL